jgi:hypothetical protein
MRRSRQLYSATWHYPKIDAIADALMYRLQYRNFVLSNFGRKSNSDASGTDAGVYWFELRNGGAGWGMNQQGYAPDANNRWMKCAMDKSGNIALGIQFPAQHISICTLYGSACSTPVLCHKARRAWWQVVVLRPVVTAGVITA